MSDKFDYKVEESILGALLIDPDSICRVASKLQPSMFHRDKNRWVYEACLSIFKRHEVIDEVTVAHELSNVDRLEAVGGAAYLPHLISELATSVHIEYHADILRQLAAKRALMTASKEIEALAELDDIDKAQGDAIGILLKLRTDAKSNAVISPKERADYALDRYSALNSNDKAIISFGLPSLDELGGMQRGEFIVLAGPSGEGKTTFGRQIAGNVARTAGNVLFVSLEMSQAQTTDRDIARLVKEPVPKVARGNYPEELYNKICGAIGELSAEPIHYYLPPVGTIPNIYAEARTLQLQHGLTFAVIDYVQLMKDVEHGDNLEERMSNISKAIKGMARELDIPILAISRNNRDKEAKDIDRLYGSGALSYDPDWIFMLKRETGDRSKLLVLKQRQGGFKLEVELIFDKKAQTFNEAKRK